MKPFRTWGKVGLVLLLLNEIRGILVVIAVLAAWSHAGEAQPPPDGVSAAARLTPLSAIVHAARAAAPRGAEPGG